MARTKARFKFEKFDHAAEFFLKKAGVKNLRGDQGGNTRCDQGGTLGLIKEEHPGVIKEEHLGVIKEEHLGVIKEEPPGVIKEEHPGVINVQRCRGTSRCDQGGTGLGVIKEERRACPLGR